MVQIQGQKNPQDGDLALQAVRDVPEEDCVLDVMSAMVKHKNVSEKTIAMLEQMLAQRREEKRYNEFEKDGIFPRPPAGSRNQREEGGEGDEK